MTAEYFLRLTEALRGHCSQRARRATATSDLPRTEHCTPSQVDRLQWPRKGCTGAKSTGHGLRLVQTRVLCTNPISIQRASVITIPISLCSAAPTLGSLGSRPQSGEALMPGRAGPRFLKVHKELGRASCRE